MKKIWMVLVLFAAFVTASAQQKTEAPVAPEAPKQAVIAAEPADVKTIDSTVHALYDVISGPAGARNWQRFHSLFAPGARMMVNSKRPGGEIVLRTMTPEDYEKRAGAFFMKEGFFETGIANKVDAFGNIAHVFSSYESRHEKDGKPFARGINSIQLVTDGQRWFVVSILWDEERPENPLPEKYLK